MCVFAFLVGLVPYGTLISSQEFTRRAYLGRTESSQQPQQQQMEQVRRRLHPDLARAPPLHSPFSRHSSVTAETETFPSRCTFRRPAGQTEAAAAAAAPAAALGGDRSAGIAEQSGAGSPGCSRLAAQPAAPGAASAAGADRGAEAPPSCAPPLLPAPLPASPPQKFGPKKETQGVGAQGGVETWTTDMTSRQLPGARGGAGRGGYFAGNLLAKGGWTLSCAGTLSRREGSVRGTQADETSSAWNLLLSLIGDFVSLPMYRFQQSWQCRLAMCVFCPRHPVRSCCIGTDALSCMQSLLE